MILLQDLIDPASFAPSSRGAPINGAPSGRETRGGCINHTTRRRPLPTIEKTSFSPGKQCKVLIFFGSVSRARPSPSISYRARRLLVTDAAARRPVTGTVAAPITVVDWRTEAVHFPRIFIAFTKDFPCGKQSPSHASSSRGASYQTEAPSGRETRGQCNVFFCRFSIAFWNTIWSRKMFYLLVRIPSHAPGL